MTTICIAGQSSLAIGVLRDVLATRPSDRIVGLTNPSEAARTRGFWQPSFRDELRRLGIEEVDLEWCAAIDDLVLISCEFERLIDVHRFRSNRLFNVHFSLLPAHKGAYPSVFAILHGDSEAGPTLHRIDAGIDTGPIIEQSRSSIGPRTSALDLFMTCQIEGRRLVSRNLESMIDDQAVAIAQTAEGSTFSSRTALDFNRLRRVNPKATASQITRQVAAANFRPFQLPVFRDAVICGAEILESRSQERFGTVLHQDSMSVRVSTIDFDVKLLVDHYPAFWRACRSGNLGEAKKLLAVVPRVDEWDERGERALAHAIRAGSPGLCEVLLEGGASTEDLDGLGTSAEELIDAEAPARARTDLNRVFANHAKNPVRPAPRKEPSDAVGVGAPNANSMVGMAFCLSEVVEDDAEFIFDLRRSAQARGNLHPVVGDVAEQRAWIRKQRRTSGDYYFTVRDRREQVAIGLIGLYRIEASSAVGEWGRWIIRPGVPAAPESLLLLLEFGFGNLGLKKIISRTVATNQRVVSFHKSLGLGDGELRTGLFNFSGVRVDAVEHAVTTETWHDVKVRLLRASSRISDSLARRGQRKGT